jgi:Sec-independent protein translocase protein TatA
MIGLMELLLIVFVAVVIYGYVRMTNKKNKKE